jgi:hypothetical protein
MCVGKLSLEQAETVSELPDGHYWPLAFELTMAILAE